MKKMEEFAFGSKYVEWAVAATAATVVATFWMSIIFLKCAQRTDFMALIQATHQGVFKSKKTTPETCTYLYRLCEI